MLSRIFAGSLVALMASTALVITVHGASSYAITVQLDETTRGDLDVIGSSLESIGPGVEVQRSLRRLATSAAGELALSSDERVDASGTLTLDDGSMAPLLDQDEISVSAVGEPIVDYVNAQGGTVRAPRKRVIIIREPCTTGSCSMKPLALVIVTNAGCRRVLLFSHPPVVGVC
jgi:hypothetical protein